MYIVIHSCRVTDSCRITVVRHAEEGNLDYRENKGAINRTGYR